MFPGRKEIGGIPRPGCLLESLAERSSQLSRGELCLPGQIVRQPRSFLASAAVGTPSDGQLISGGRR